MCACGTLLRPHLVSLAFAILAASLFAPLAAGDRGRSSVPRLGGLGGDAEWVFPVLTAAVAAFGMLYYLSQMSKPIPPGSKSNLPGSKPVSPGSDPVPRSSPPDAPPRDDGRAETDDSTVSPAAKLRFTPFAEASKKEVEERAKAEKKRRHAQLETADREAKALFRAKKHLEAAAKFTEALDMCHEIGNLDKQAITLLNNRSAMYERAGEIELAIADCDVLLNLDPFHEKARVKRMRMYESRDMFSEALTEACALQLRFMKENSDALRRGVQKTPPVAQSKIEELVKEILPGEVERCWTAVLERREKRGGGVRFPIAHTVVQLMSSFSSYDGWFEQAEKDVPVVDLTQKIEGIAEDVLPRARYLMRRGKKFAYEKKFKEAAADFEDALKSINAHVGDDDDATVKFGRDYPRLLEWVGICRHLRYDLSGALDCYEICALLEPMNVELMVRKAGIKMDDAQVDEATELFDVALGLEPDSRDVLLHRSNLWLLKADVDAAKKDLERLISLHPNFLLGRLRLATVLMQTNDIPGARASLEAAGRICPTSSDVHSYLGELRFAEGDLSGAREDFEKAMQLDPLNPTPYVNSGLATMQTPGPNGLPDVREAIGLFEKALVIDPQFFTAYLHLGQLRLSIAQSIMEAREVVELYDRGLRECRSKDELNDLCSMKVLTMAQINAAMQLKMETFR